MIHTVLSWSSGKDAAYTLHKLRQSEKYTIRSLFSTLDEKTRKISMHGIHESLLDAQAAALGIPVQKLYLPADLPEDAYAKIIKEKLLDFRKQGITSFAFGDILLDDLKSYREKQLAAANIEAVFPLWKRDTKILAREIIGSGIRAVVVTVNSAVLDAGFLGREYDGSFLTDLPAGVDPCGENGEFHTFVYDAPFFRNPVSFKKGKIFSREFHGDSKKEKTWDTSFLFLELVSQ